jgi:hypothetical protein
MNLYDLVLLANNSAIEIDSNIIRKVYTGYSYVRELAQEMENASRNYLDSTEILLFVEVIWPNEKDRIGRNVDEVYLQTNLLAKDLFHFSKFPKERQEELRNICVGLSRQASKHNLLSIRD